MLPNAPLVTLCCWPENPAPPHILTSGINHRSLPGTAKRCCRGGWVLVPGQVSGDCLRWQSREGLHRGQEWTGRRPGKGQIPCRTRGPRVTSDVPGTRTGRRPGPWPGQVRVEPEPASGPAPLTTGDDGRAVSAADCSHRVSLSASAFSFKCLLRLAWFDQTLTES